ncbi:caspase family protein [Kitasatospora indigofera]|uniref:caspase family protein n=1 Tax=Kitasatospora indigofera TaxID=67307 RepID=UPI0036C9ED6A
MAGWLPRPGRVRALLIGTTDGPGGLPQIPGDLAAVRRALTDPRSGIAEASQVRTLTAPTAGSVLAAVRSARRRPRLDLLLLYFSGHGHLDPVDQSLRLGMADSACRPDRPDSFGLSYDVLAAALRRTGAAQVVVVLDCCYSGRALHDTERRENCAVLASVQANRETPQDHGKALSPYTEVLVEQLGLPPNGQHTSGVDVALLHERIAGRFKFRLLPVGDTDREPTRAEVEALSEDDRRAHSWSPQYSHTGSAVILSRPGGEPPPRRARVRLPAPVRAASRATAARLSSAAARCRPLLPGLRTATRLGVVLALLAGGLAWWSHGGEDPYPCPLPLQLRVLASTESRAAVAAAADGFEGSSLNHRRLAPGDRTPAQCRRITLSVYAAPADLTRSAFAAAADWADGARPGPGPAAAGCDDPAPAASPAAGEAAQGEAAPGPAAAGRGCLVPLRDVGPQPDLWIPDSSAELAEVQTRPPALDGLVLASRGPLALTPLVLGLPPQVAAELSAAGVQPRGSSWETILAALQRLPAPVQLLRPNPATSATGLLQTVGLYLGYQGTLGRQVTLPDAEARRLEKGFAVPGRSSGDARQLLCELASQAGKQDQLAVLVTEQALSRLDAGAPDVTGCADRPSAAPGPGLARYYPAGAPVLDHPMVTVSWPGARDGAQRLAAAGLFRDWLLAPDGGGRAWTDQGFELPAPVDGATGPGPAGPDTAQITTALAGYAQARLPGRVLFLLDVSGSTADNGKLAASVAALDRALRVLGPQDSYGLWTFPAAGTAGSGHDEPVPLGSTDPVAGGRALSRAVALPLSAQLYEAVTQGLDALREGAGRQPQLLVVITDGDIRRTDDPQGQEAARALLRSAALGRPQIPVVVAALPAAGCHSTLDDLAAFSGGRCLPGADGLGSQLAGLVAAVGSGGTG